MMTMMIRQDKIIDNDKMIENDKTIDNEGMEKMKGGRQKCQIINTIAIMCKEPRVQNMSHDGKP